MTKNFYRFRSIENLLGKNQELEKQEIYFAAPGQLNDPMEGFKEMFWHGDAILWKNLFKHYVLCLTHGCSLLAILGEEQPLDWNLFPIENLIDSINTSEMRALYDEIIAKFFSNKLIQRYVRLLAARKQPVLENELGVHLFAIHPFAISLIYDIFHKRGLGSKPKGNSSKFTDSIDARIKASIKMIDSIDKLDISDPDKKAATEAFFSAERKLLDQMDLINRYNNFINPAQKNRLFVFLDFPEGYIQQLDRLVHPHWYAACFMEYSHDSAAWGHYGNGHQGVCLKFRARNSEGKYFIDLIHMNGWNNAGPIYGSVSHEFFPVAYQSKHVNIDFFRSLGNLPIPVINRDWYYDGQIRSAIMDEKSGLNEEFRNEYWKRFSQGVTTKLDHWKYENEHRLLLYGQLLDFSETKDRLAKYNFSDLEGLIFGIKTTTDDKLAVMRVIEEKCRTFGRKDFKFYQAFYSREKACIDHVELPLLRL